MGWFDEQIRTRKQSDQEAFDDSFFRVAAAVLGSREAGAINDKRIVAKEAIDEILKYFHIKPAPLPGDVKELEDAMEYALRPGGIMRRRICLTPGWRRNAIGPILAFKKETGEAVALLPKRLMGYYHVNRLSGERITVTAAAESEFEEEAFSFYKPLPLRAIDARDVIRYAGSCISTADAAIAVISTFLLVMASMMAPKLVQVLTGPVLQSGNSALIIYLGCFMAAVLVASLLINASRELIMKRISVKTRVPLEAAVMMRVLSLRSEVFRKHTTGDLTVRAAGIGYFCDMVITNIFDVGIFLVFSLLYLLQIRQLAPPLAMPSLIVFLLVVLFSIASSAAEAALSREKTEASAGVYGLGYSIISGIRKIKLSGAEKRVFARWNRSFAGEARLLYNPPGVLKVRGIWEKAVLIGGAVYLCYAAAAYGVPANDFAAFVFSYALMVSAVARVGELTDSVARIPSVIDLARPILEAEPEAAEGREVLTRLSGSIELSHISFRYQDDTPYVINDLSLRIRRGEYVAIVGMSGSGKSTLMRLLLGFEKPQKGAIYYDGRDAERIDLKSLRRRVGTVLQNGSLIKGDIYDNISVCAPGLSMRGAWEAAALAGIAEDIKAMPMGMNTLVTDGGGGFSGGQRQRILIARALATKPSILMFDEATSSLDNRTQKQVSDAISGLGCTRIVIAHRLSTIKNCDRILLLENGRIAEEGSYEALMEKGGAFAELVKRQHYDFSQQ